MNSLIMICVASMLAAVPSQGPATAPATAPASQPAQAGPLGEDTHVLIVVGISKDAGEGAGKNQVAAEFRKLLVSHAAVLPGRVTLLAEESDFWRTADAKSSGRSDAATIRREMERLAAGVQQDDAFVFYYAGQANLVGEQLRLNLPGPDLTHTELAELIRKVPAGRKIVILDCPCAGLLAETLADKAAIVICAARSDQPYSTQFGQFFISALVEAQSDANGDGQVSLLEAFTRASQQIEQAYKAGSLMMTEIPLLEDDGDGVPSQQPWAHGESGGDGRSAAVFHMLRGIPGAGATTLKPPSAVTGPMSTSQPALGPDAF